MPAGPAARRGGTLTMAGAGNVDHLDPALAYHTVTRGLLRAYTRQLVGYAAGRDRAAAGRIVADLARTVPVARDGVHYHFHLRNDVCWDTPAGARPVTAADVVPGARATVSAAGARAVRLVVGASRP